MTNGAVTRNGTFTLLDAIVSSSSFTARLSGLLEGPIEGHIGGIRLGGEADAWIAGFL